VYEDAVCLNSSERDDGGHRHLQAEQRDELLDGLGEDSVAAKGEPEQSLVSCCFCPGGHERIPDQGQEHADVLEPAGRQVG
jgi:hypothetical protein